MIFTFKIKLTFKFYVDDKIFDVKIYFYIQLPRIREVVNYELFVIRKIVKFSLGILKQRQLSQSNILST